MKTMSLAVVFAVIATSAQAITVSNLNLNTYGTNIIFEGINNVVNAK